jgi:hypothetical protein
LESTINLIHGVWDDSTTAEEGSGAQHAAVAVGRVSSRGRGRGGGGRSDCAFNVT